MNQQNNFPLRGLFRAEKEFLSDYRQRAHLVGKYLLYASLLYLMAAVVLNELMLVISSEWKIQSTYLIESKTQTIGALKATLKFSGFNWTYSEDYVLMCLNIFRAILHVFSSVFLMLATYERIAKFRVIRFCNWTRRMNLAFLMYEIIVVGFIYRDLELVFIFVLYRIYLNHEVRGLLNTVEMLSPPPPGYRSWLWSNVFLTNVD